MGEMNKLLRLLVQADVEAKTQKLEVGPTPGPHTKISTALVGGNTRKSIAVYNNSDSGSGDCFYGFHENISPSGDAMVVPKGSMVSIPVADTSNIDLYFCAASGEIGDLRIEELA